MVLDAGRCKIGVGGNDMIGFGNDDVIATRQNWF